MLLSDTREHQRAEFARRVHVVIVTNSPHVLQIESAQYCTASSVNGLSFFFYLSFISLMMN